MENVYNIHRSSAYGHLIVLFCFGIIWLRLYYPGPEEGGHEGLNSATPQKILTNTASPQEQSTKHRHRNNNNNYVITSTLDVILLHLNNFPQNKHIKTYACQCMPTRRYC